MSRSWSSGMGCISSSAAAGALGPRPPRRMPRRARARRPSRANTCARRTRSIARLRAVVMIHAPGLSGSRRAGHRSSAVTIGVGDGLLGEVEVARGRG